MKKYTTPAASVVALCDESEIMLQTGSKFAEEGQYSNAMVFDEEDEEWDAE